jgi:hypothetical protein
MVKKDEIGSDRHEMNKKCIQNFDRKPQKPRGTHKTDRTRILKITLKSSKIDECGLDSS